MPFTNILCSSIQSLNLTSKSPIEAVTSRILRSKASKICLKIVNAIFKYFMGSLFSNFAPTNPPSIPPIAQHKPIFQSI